MFKSPNKNELEKNLGVAQDLVPKPTSYRPFKSIKDVKAKLNKRMSPEEVAEWVNDFQSVMSELVKQNIVAAQKLIDSTRLSESVFQTPFGRRCEYFVVLSSLLKSMLLPRVSTICTVSTRVSPVIV